MNTADTYSLFEKTGGLFSIPLDDFIKKITPIKAFVFDWDGVFNEGKKSQNAPSSFHEADSMGLNMLRYGFWLKNEQNLPFCVILTGADNPTARSFAQREHFHGIYSQVKDKASTLEKICQQYTLTPLQVCYIFDDINDLKVAQKVGLRIQVNRPGSPLFHKYTLHNKLRDYLTAQPGGQFAIREVSELLLGMYQVYDQVVASRAGFDGRYSSYWKNRQEVQTESMEATNTNKIGYNSTY